MGLRMATPWKHEPSGVYYFRQRIPADLVAVVGRRLEKHSLRTKNEREAIGKFRIMAAEHQARWDEMRKGRQSLSHKQCVALSKEIYDDFLVQRETGEPIRGFIGLPLFLGACEEARNIEIGSKAERLQKLEGLHGERVREMLSRYGYFVDDITYRMLLDTANSAAIQGMQIFSRHVEGDYSEDPQIGRFPKFEAEAYQNPEHKFDALWADYCKDRQPSPKTIKKWLPYFDLLMAWVVTDDMSKVTEAHLLAWRDHLQTLDLSPLTIRDGYIAAMKAFFGWAKKKKKLAHDPSAEVHVEVSEKSKANMRGLTAKEAQTILSATLAPFSSLMSSENVAARRWVPWLCAYTGTRVNEITQLRAMDVKEVDGIWCIEITPEAGDVKTSEKRLVPLHPHLVEQGFLDFAARKKGKRPLFYSLERQRGVSRKNPTYVSVGNKLAEWVRGLGIDDPLVHPSHGWRHRFKTVGRQCGMDWIILDRIQGHAPRTEGEKYGEVLPDVMLTQIQKHPRYEVIAAASVDHREKKLKAKRKDTRLSLVGARDF
jgi:integrase